MITVTKPFIPPLEEYQDYLKGIWQRNWLTNHGPLVNELELKIKGYYKLDHLLYVANGTLALQIAIKALDLKGDIITTPFSYVATSSSIVWEGCNPVYVDIDEKTLNIDPDLIEGAITDKTRAILATHVYGIPCDVDKISEIAKNYNLEVIYDAAHAFGVQYKGKSLYSYGDISTASFHATKLFHTVEGGAVITQSAELLKKMAYLRNFGHESPTDFAMVGINGKNSEFHAAMGLCNLKYIDQIIIKRKELSEYYNLKLKSLNITRPTLPDQTIYNYGYYPIIFQSESDLTESKTELVKYNIFTRRYFYPSLNNLNYVADFKVPISESIARRVLCLPLFYDLSFEEINMISRLLLRIQNN